MNVSQQFVCTHTVLGRGPNIENVGANVPIINSDEKLLKRSHAFYASMVGFKVYGKC